VLNILTAVLHEVKREVFHVSSARITGKLKKKIIKESPINNIHSFSKTLPTLIFISRNNDISHQLTENISCVMENVTFC